MALAAAAVLVLGVLTAVDLSSARIASAGPPPALDPRPGTAGALAGGETVELTGVHLAAVSAVEFGGREARIDAVSNGRIQITVPNYVDYTPGTVEVSLHADGAELDAGFAHRYDELTAIDRQLANAFTHWDDYNTAAYGDFNVWGGDCMNFVSQTLVARGWTPTSDWFNDAQHDWASAFVYVPDFDEWMSRHPELGATRLGMADLHLLKPGDVVMIDWEGNGFFNHAQVVSAIEYRDGEPRVLMVGHNADSTYRDLQDALDRFGTEDAVAYFWSLPA